jgi:hypothetical protein
MDYKKVIDKLVRELSYRVGIPNIHNKEHQSIMSEILSEWGEYDVKQTIFEFLTNEDDTEGEDKQYSHIGAGIYVKKGDEKKDNAQKYKKDDSGSIKPISDDEYDKTKSSQGDDGEKAASNTDQNQQGGGSNDEKGNQEEPKTNAFSGDGGDEYKKNLPDGDPAKKKKDASSSKSDEKQIMKKLSKSQQSARRVSKKINSEQLKSNDPNLSEEEIQHMDKFSNLTDEFLNNDTSEERKREIAQQLKEDYDLKTNTETIDEDGNPKKVKLYIKKNYDGGKVPRSIETSLGGGKSWSANDGMRHLTNELNKYLDDDNKVSTNSIGGKSESALKVEFEKAAKPSFKIEGGETKREKTRQNPITKGKRKDPNNPGYDVNGNPLTITDPLVSQIFEKNTALGDLKESMHSLEGPADADGNMIPCDSPENKRKHYDFLINNNDSFDKVKQQSQKYINDPNVSESDKEKFRNIVKSIDSYKEEMNKLKNEIPSEEAEKKVQELNRKLMIDIHESHPDIASGMAKQFAENALVTQEIAAGDEVYMPSNGSFPGGDKIVVTRNGAKMEAVAGVSVKFGRSSKQTEIYGFPGESQSMARFAEPERKSDETDEEFQARKEDIRTRNGKYVGQDGYLFGVRDDIVKDKDKFDKILEQSGMNEVVTDSEKLHKLNNEIHSEVERWMKEQRDKTPPPTEKSIRIGLQKHIKGWMKKNNIQNRFEECIDRTKLTKSLTGTDDGNYTTKGDEERKHSNANLASGCNPLEFMGMTSFASSVKEGKGMPSLLWNHQSYEDNDYQSATTDPGDTDMTDLSNWGFSSRLFVTSGRQGGGILATGTGEKKNKKNPLE